MSVLKLMLADFEPFPPAGEFVGPPTPMQDMARRWLAEVAAVREVTAADAGVKRFFNAVEAA